VCNSDHGDERVRVLDLVQSGARNGVQSQQRLSALHRLGRALQPLREQRGTRHTGIGLCEHARLRRRVRLRESGLGVPMSALLRSEHRRRVSGRDDLFSPRESAHSRGRGVRGVHVARSMPDRE
jgi:hypothetical protein